MSGPGPVVPVSGEQAAAFDLGEGDCAVLCLHGFTGTPYEVRPLGEALAAAGYRARGPLLPGHGSSLAELAGASYRDWLAAAHAEFRELAGRHERVCVVGLSMGGLLTLSLCAEQPVAMAAVIGTPLRLRFPIPQLVPLLRYVLPSVPKRGGSDIRDPLARARHPSAPRMPLAGIHEVLRAQRHVRALLPRIATPLLVAHGRHDATADPRHASRICRAVSSTRCERLMLENSAHVVPVDHDGPQLAAALVAFLGGSREASQRC